jgi:hypothetical protein
MFDLMISQIRAKGDALMVASEQGEAEYRATAVVRPAMAFEALLRPVRDLAGLPLHYLIFGNVANQIGRNCLGIRTELVNKFSVPKMMEISRLERSCRHPLVISAPIMIICSVQRLMQVADEVENELESHNLLFGIGCRVRKLACEFSDLVGDAIVCGPV